jgi:hypothetical protein
MTDNCTICFDEIVHPVEYKKNSKPNEWFKITSCLACIMVLKQTQFSDYINTIQTTDCKRTLARLLSDGPPIWISDKLIFKNVNYDLGEHVIEIRCNNEIICARLDNSVDGDDRLTLWNSLKLIFGTHSLE